LCAKEKYIEGNTGKCHTCYKKAMNVEGQCTVCKVLKKLQSKTGKCGSCYNKSLYTKGGCVVCGIHKTLHAKTGICSLCYTTDGMGICCRCCTCQVLVADMCVPCRTRDRTTGNKFRKLCVRDAQTDASNAWEVLVQVAGTIRQNDSESCKKKGKSIDFESLSV
jgi:hypothetical protein